MSSNLQLKLLQSCLEGLLLDLSPYCVSFCLCIPVLGIRPERESYTFSLARGQVPISLSEHSSTVKGKPHSNRKSQLCPKTMLLQRSTYHSCLNFRDIVKLTFETTSHNVSLRLFLTCKQEWLERVTQKQNVDLTKTGAYKRKAKATKFIQREIFLKC